MFTLKEGVDKVKVLVVGGGGREHALVWKLSQNRRIKKLYCAPGNAGIAALAACVPLAAEDVAGLVAFARQEEIDLVVVGPEAPLAAGLVDELQKERIAAFGPTAAAAVLESSKVFAKDLMARYGIPTADYRRFADYRQAQAYLADCTYPVVIKADGLAAGKGVVVAGSRFEAEKALKDMMVERVFGTAGEQVVIEEYLEGEELSLLAFTDGENVVPLLPAQDHKRVYDNDEGPNTGGMGAYAPAPVGTEAVCRQVVEEILRPAVNAMAAEGRPYRGVLYAGLMITAAGPRVLEFNVRFGDPEAQPLLVLMKDDLLDVIEATLTGEIRGGAISWHPGAAVCVVMASAGYPGAYEKGLPISGLERVPDDVVVFHAGTAFKDDRIVTAGGRVLGVTALGDSITSAIKRAYEAVDLIHFPGCHYRTDIGRRALQR